MGEENSMRKGNCKKICVVMCVIFIILSVTLGAKVINNPSVYKGTIDSLDKKTETVIKLTGLATATSAAITVIPAGVWMSDEITRIYGINLDEVVQSGEEAKNLTEDTAKSTDEPEEEQSILESIASVISDLKDMVAGAVTGALDKAADFLKNLTESLAVLIVTTCVIPIVTLIGSLWIIKWIIGVDFVGKLVLPCDGLSSSQKKTFRRAKDM